MINWVKRRALLFTTFFIGRFRRRVIGPHVHALLCETENGKLLIHASDFSIGKKLAFNGCYQLDNLRELMEFIREDSRVLVVGTHIGSFLIPFAKKARAVVGVEANPETRFLLEANLFINGITNTQILPFAASNHTGEVEFLMSHDNTGGSKIPPSVEPWEFVYDHPNRIKVQAEPLDAHLQGPFDLVVMDVEGAEYQALCGMEKVLEQVRVLQVEYIPFVQGLAGVSPQDFAGLLARHFARMRFAGKPEVWGRERFAEVLESMRTVGNDLGEDLLLFKD